MRQGTCRGPCVATDRAPRRAWRVVDRAARRIWLRVRVRDGGGVGWGALALLGPLLMLVIDTYNLSRQLAHTL